MITLAWVWWTEHHHINQRNSNTDWRDFILLYLFYILYLVEIVQMLTDVTEQNPAPFLLAWIRGAVMRNEQIWPHSWKTAEVSPQIIVDRLFIPWKISKSSEKNPTLIVSGLHLRRAGEGKGSWFRNVLTEIFCYTVLYSLGWLLTDFIVSFMCLFVCLFIVCLY